MVVDVVRERVKKNNERKKENRKKEERTDGKKQWKYI
jgi:hypothetical protein